MSGIVKEHVSKKQRVQRKGFFCAMLLLFFFWIVIASIFRGDKQGDAQEKDSKYEQREIQKGEQAMQKLPNEIRVLIRTSSYEGLYHDSLELQGDTEVVFDDGREERCIPCGEVIRLQKGDAMFGEGDTIIRIYTKTEDGRLTVKNLLRSQGIPSYKGRMEIREIEEGLVLVNVLPLEDYLCGVLPSEMPSNFPEEALKAQAICARTYAYGKLKDVGYPDLGADLDDSTAFQVYGNLAEQESCTNAVRATRGLVLVDERGNLMDTFYYSTSCGRGTDVTAWQGNAGTSLGMSKGKKISRTAMQTMLKNADNRKVDKKEAEDKKEKLEDADFLLLEDSDDYESDLPWYRWTYEVERIENNEMANRIRHVLNSEEEFLFQSISAISITRRGVGGVALELKIITDQGEYTIQGEHAIREVLCDGRTEVVQRDGTRFVCSSLLPSAFFLMETSATGENVIGYSLNGGGLGHGIGMSQNAAGVMAKEGHNAEEILAFFYEGGRLHDIR